MSRRSKNFPQNPTAEQLDRIANSYNENQKVEYAELVLKYKYNQLKQCALYEAAKQSPNFCSGM